MIWPLYPFNLAYIYAISLNAKYKVKAEILTKAILFQAKQKNMFVSGRLMIWNRVGRSAFNFFVIFFLKEYNAECKIKCFVHDFNKLLYRISLNKTRSWSMVFNCNINAFSNLTSIIYLYNENMNLEMTIKKLGSAYKFRVGRATGNEHIFLFGPILTRQSIPGIEFWDIFFFN